MILYLDDIRNPPDASWVVVRTAKECIEALETVFFDQISLDHDLGEPVEECGTGYEVIKWLEERVFTDANFMPPHVITIHSANPVGRRNMEAGIKSIRKIVENRNNA